MKEWLRKRAEFGHDQFSIRTENTFNGRLLQKLSSNGHRTRVWGVFFINDDYAF